MDFISCSFCSCVYLLLEPLFYCFFNDKSIKKYLFIKLYYWDLKNMNFLVLLIRYTLIPLIFAPLRKNNRARKIVKQLQFHKKNIYGAGSGLN